MSQGVEMGVWECWDEEDEAGTTRARLKPSQKFGQEGQGSEEKRLR